MEWCLFSGRDVDPSDPKTMAADDETMSKVSTIESPCLEQLSDYLVDSSSEGQEFSTDVSSTHKKRN